MEHLVWDEKYGVNIEVIDQQHKKLFTLLGDLYDGMGKERSADVLGRIVAELAQYAVEHFATEEIFMRQYDFPGLAKHKKEHEAFKEKVGAFQKDFAAGKATLSMEVLSFLTAWLDHHILKVDQAYAPFLNEKGVC